MGKALLLVIVLVLMVYAFFDLYATPSRQVQRLPKPLWFLVVLAVPVAGPLLWLFLGSSQTRQPPRGRPNRGHSPGPVGPDDDPDFLRGL